MSGHSIELRNKCDKEKCRFHCNHLACSAELAMEVGEVEEATVVQEEGEEDRKESLMEWIDRQLEEAERKTSGSPWPEEAGGEGGSGPGNKVKRSDSASKVAERSDTKSHDSTETDSEIEATTDSDIELLESPRGRGGEGRLLEDSDSEEEQKDKGGEDKDGAWTSSDPTGNPENNSWRVKLAREEENR